MRKLKMNIFTVLLMFGMAIQGRSLAAEQKYISQVVAEEIMHKLNQGIDQKVTGYQVTLTENTKIEWQGKGVLVLEAQDNVVFEPGSFIKSRGKGGLLLKPGSDGDNSEETKTGTVIFADQESLYIDFSEGVGFISMFYNPQGDVLKQKYLQCQNWSKNIKAQKGHFTDYMYINKCKDINYERHIDGNYVLAANAIATYKTTKFPSNFKGKFLYNEHFLQNSYGHAYENVKLQNHIFENLPYKWCGNIFYISPPLLKKERDFFKASKKDNLDLFQKLFRNSYKTYGGAFFIINEEGDTPLHVATRAGSNKIIDFILSLFSNPSFHKGHLGESEFFIKNLINHRNNEGLIPLELATSQGNFEAFEKLCKFYDRIHGNIPVDHLKKIIEQGHGRILVTLTNINEPPQGFDKLGQGFPKVIEAEAKEYSRQQEVLRRFFVRPLSSYRTLKILEDTKEKYEQAQPLNHHNLNGIPSRSRIILMRNILSLKLGNFFDGKNKESYWTLEGYYEGGQQEKRKDKFPTVFLFGGEKHTFTYFPTNDKPGNNHYEQLGTYEAIRSQLDELLKKLPDAILATIMHTSRISGNPVTCLDFQKYNSDTTLGDQEARFINRLLLLLDSEVVSRLFYKNKNGDISEYDQIPIAFGCARSFLLQRGGFSCFKNLLKTGENLFEDSALQRRQALGIINTQFNQRNLPRIALFEDWRKTHPLGLSISTSEKMHQELLEAYGGGYESDGEDYEND